MVSLGLTGVLGLVGKNHKSRPKAGSFSVPIIYFVKQRIIRICLTICLRSVNT